jgi:hypothetical protein
MRAFYVPLALRFVVPSAGSSALNGDPVNLLSFQFQRAKPAEIPSKSDAASSGSFPTTDVISKKIILRHGCPCDLHGMDHLRLWRSQKFKSQPNL